MAVPNGQDGRGRAAMPLTLRCRANPGPGLDEGCLWRCVRWRCSGFCPRYARAHTAKRLRKCQNPGAIKATTAERAGEARPMLITGWLETETRSPAEDGGVGEERGRRATPSLASGLLLVVPPLSSGSIAGSTTSAGRRGGPRRGRQDRNAPLGLPDPGSGGWWEACHMAEDGTIRQGGEGLR